MIEVLFAKAWNGLAPSRGKLTAKTRDFFNSLPSKRVGVILTIAIPLLVIIWHGTAALINRPAHLDKIVKELGSTTIGRFFRNPMPDHSGTRLLFLESTENGVGLFLSKVGDGHRKLLYEELYKQPNTPSDRFLGWSPDDKFFAYSRDYKQWEIAICDGDTGNTLATFPTTTRAVSGAWLSHHNLAFACEDQVLYEVENSQGKWTVPEPFDYFKNASDKLKNDPIENLTAFDADSVVWQQGNAIWSCGEHDDVPVKIWDATTNTMIEFSYSQAAQKFLLHCKDATGQFFMVLYPDRPEQAEDITRINPKQYNPRDLTLINDGKGYVFMSHDTATSNTFVIKFDDSHVPTQVPWPHQVTGFAASQHEIFIASSLGNRPIEINEYDMASGSVECAAPMTEQHFEYLTNYTMECNQITNAAGENLKYYLFESPHHNVKKHPLIIGVPGAGQIGYAWAEPPVAFANCGCYYVYVDREQRDPSEWAQDMFTVYESLVKRPDIDANNVYLYGISVGALQVYELLREKPGLWKGAILLNPILSTDPTQFTAKKIFIDCGDSDPNFGKDGSEVPRRFQDAIAKSGIPVTLLIHPGQAHSLWSPSAERERMREALIFLNEP